MKIEVTPETAREKYFCLIENQVNLFFNNLSINPETVVSFNFVSGAKIKALNKKYRRIDRVTDVLSFPIWENIDQMPKTGAANLGDIFIFAGAILKNAASDNRDFKEELETMVQHSLNHLVGKHH